MYCENCKKIDPYRQIKLKRNDKYVALVNLNMYHTQKDIKVSYKNNKYKTLAPTWNEKLKLSNGLTSVSNTQVIQNRLSKSRKQ